MLCPFGSIPVADPPRPDSPGTEFMAALSQHLDFFVKKKMKEDPAWRGIKVIFSGHDVQPPFAIASAFCLCLTGLP